ncbi:MAG: hypothetical protein KJ922_02555, partial [Nanoarchaeota archaeon]|nr:hypothetical protein [Nanoarchaeota archaeon]
MVKVELFVKLVIPDTTAITAFHTLEKMGANVEKLERYEYFSFDVDPAEGFLEKAKKTDVLVNANKHKAVDILEKDEGVSLLVQDIESGHGLLNTLRERLGLTEIKSM